MVSEFAAPAVAMGHVVRRGVSAAQEHLSSMAASPEFMAQLQQDAEAYENAGPGSEIRPAEMLPVLLTALIMFIVLASVRYTLGDVIASLAMIESPSSIAIVESKPPAYRQHADEPHAPLPKEGLMAEPDVEVTLLSQPPITASVRTTMSLISRECGFSGKWRGLSLSMAYHFAHGLLTQFLSGLFGFSLPLSVLFYILSSVLLARFHMLWTHSMIAKPTNKRLSERLVARKDSKALLLPTVVHALAQQATFLVPVLVAVVMGVPWMQHGQVRHAIEQKKCGELAWAAVRVLAIPASALVMALFVLLPASAALTRVEAVLLPEDMDTLVPFDRDSLLGDVDLTMSSGRRALFKQAWHSFDRSARLRLVKLYVKLGFIQFVVFLTGLHLMLLEGFVIGGERLGTFLQSASAQLQLMAIEAQKQH